MQTVRHWRMQATRYRLNQLRPKLRDSEKEVIPNSEEASKSTERPVQDLVVQVVPISS